jgi:hypothetical protein
MNFSGKHRSPWRGSLLPLECAALTDFGAASQPGGSKLPRHKALVQSAGFVFSLVTLSACTVGPDFQKPEAQQVTEWSKPSKAAASLAINETLNERWWEVFNDPKLSSLSQRALTDNLDLKLAGSRLQQSRAVRQVVTADRYPTTSVDGSYARRRNSSEGLMDPSGNNGNSAFNLWDAGFSASWELDFWGRVRRETEAADATLEVAENDRRGVLLSVLADTAQSYIQLRGVQNTRAVTEQNLDVARHSLKLSQLRLADGVATDLDVAEAAAQVAAIESRRAARVQRRVIPACAGPSRTTVRPRREPVDGRAATSVGRRVIHRRASAADPAPGRHRAALATGRAPSGHPRGRSPPACRDREHRRGQG